jgi:hypothetical protein
MPRQRPIYYRLDDHTPVPIDSTDITRWWPSQRSREHDPWRVAGTEFPDGRYLSTVFLGIDHQYLDGPPLLFETMLFDDPRGDEQQWRWSTWDEAEAGHAAVVAELEGGE